MDLDVHVPEVGESVREAVLAEWYVGDGERVGKDQTLFLLETDKITLEVAADTDGVLQILAKAGSTVQVGEVVARIQLGKERESSSDEEEGAKAEDGGGQAQEREEKEAPEPERKKEERAAPPPRESDEATRAGPAARSLAREHKLDLTKIHGTGPGGLVTKGDVLASLESRSPQRSESEEEPAREGPRPEAKQLSNQKGSEPAPDVEAGGTSEKPIRKEPLSPIRKRIAQRLLQAKHATAMLTTFNEMDMSRVLELRTRYKASFAEQHGIKLGLMSFFVKASVAALRSFPRVNASIEEENIVYHDYFHIGMAIGAERGLVVPVIRHADRLSMADIERVIADYLGKVEKNRLQLSDLEGGTFTITNGGVFGSLLSTPILNYPQSAILGLHKIEDRPIAVDGEVAVRPMMYVALSYDHRIIDGREAVQFLVRVKEEIEEPDRMLLEV